jgi:hypothetical protein
MSGSVPRHLAPNEAGQESREAQSAFIGGGRSQPILSAARFGDANEGSRRKHHPALWALGWVGGIVVVIAALVLILR